MKLDNDGKVIEMEIEGVNYTHINTYMEKNDIKVHRTNLERNAKKHNVEPLRLKGSVFIRDDK